MTGLFFCVCSKCPNFNFNGVCAHFPNQCGQFIIWGGFLHPVDKIHHKGWVMFRKMADLHRPAIRKANIFLFTFREGLNRKSTAKIVLFFANEDKFTYFFGFVQKFFIKFLESTKYLPTFAA